MQESTRYVLRRRSNGMLSTLIGTIVVIILLSIVTYNAYASAASAITDSSENPYPQTIKMED